MAAFPLLIKLLAPTLPLKNQKLLNPGAVCIVIGPPAAVVERSIFV
jgi:hypothetical protein